MSLLRYVAIFCAVLSFSSAYADVNIKEDSLMHAEADAFLNTLPPGLQNRQTQAIL